MNPFIPRSIQIFCSSMLALLLISSTSYCQNDFEKIEIKAIPVTAAVKMLEAENGFGGGNVAASVGLDGILLVDNMYEIVTPKLMTALKVFSDSSIRIVINTHFHADHIQGNNLLSASSVIVAHENVYKRLSAKSNWATSKSLPLITISEKMNIHFNGEDIRIFHLPNGHTDGDLYVYFTGSKVIHMGDTYFNGMFPAVYKEGGGDILQMIKNLEKILTDIPEDVAVIPGHGKLATKKELSDYVLMLKETTSLVLNAINAGSSIEQLKQAKPFSKYDALGEGGAQTTDQYLAMLYKLLSR